jgi:integrase
MRIGEARNLTWVNIDLEDQCITLNNPEKRGKPRAFKISSKLTAMLNVMPKNKEGPFKGCYSNLYRDFENQRKNNSQKTAKPKATPYNIPHVSPLESYYGIP